MLDIGKATLQEHITNVGLICKSKLDGSLAQVAETR